MRNERDKIKEYKTRRDARLAKRGMRNGHSSRKDGVDAFYDRRNERLANRGIPEIRRVKKARVDSADSGWYNKDGAANRFDSNQQIAFGLCEREGIKLPKGATPREAWEALKEKGITPESAYQNASASQPSGGSDNSGEVNKAKASSITGSFAKKRGMKKEAPTFSQSVKEALDHGMSEEKIAQVLDNLSDEDFYEINGESGVIGLAAKIDDEVVGKSEEVQRMWEKAKTNGTPITRDVIEITQSLGASMSGLEFAVKAGKSTSEKIDRDHEEDKKEERPERTDEEVFASLNDVVRFTQFSPHEKLAENALKTIETLKGKGYTIETCKNRYALEDQEYYDIKIVARNPEGQAFELQFHSKESLEVKNKNHGLYEEQRKVGVSEERKKELGAQMKEIAASLPKPRGFEKVPQIVNGVVKSGG